MPLHPCQKFLKAGEELSEGFEEIMLCDAEPGPCPIKKANLGAEMTHILAHTTKARVVLCMKCTHVPSTYPECVT